jgi:hypothetical protein
MPANPLRAGKRDAVEPPSGGVIVLIIFASFNVYENSINCAHDTVIKSSCATLANLSPKRWPSQWEIDDPEMSMALEGARLARRSIFFRHEVSVKFLRKRH